MTFRSACRLALAAARANLLPGLLLQALMAVFLTLYVAHEGTRTALTQVADWKQQAGLAFAFFSYVLSAAVLPELLKIVFFQNGRATRANLAHFLAAAPAWGLMGVVVDVFYRGQALWFGPGNAWHVLVLKVAVDQFVFSPFFSNPVMVGYFAWWREGFRRGALGKLLTFGFYLERVFPVQVAGWIVWIPGVTVVYFMPSALQFPVASLIQCFWVLVFTFVNRPRGAGR
jgi:hypothetical protein